MEETARCPGDHVLMSMTWLGFVTGQVSEIASYTLCDYWILLESTDKNLKTNHLELGSLGRNDVRLYGIEETKKFTSKWKDRDLSFRERLLEGVLKIRF